MMLTREQMKEKYRNRVASLLRYNMGKGPRGIHMDDVANILIDIIFDVAEQSPNHFEAETKEVGKRTTKKKWKK